MGIDVSKVAIERAAVNASERNQFVVARIEDFSTEEKFDIIIFNECLYYLEDPVKILNSYEKFLAPDGLFIVSMHRNHQSWKIWRRIDKSHPVKDAVLLKHPHAGAWIVRVLGVRENVQSASRDSDEVASPNSVLKQQAR